MRDYVRHVNRWKPIRLILLFDRSNVLCIQKMSVENVKEFTSANQARQPVWMTKDPKHKERAMLAKL